MNHKERIFRTLNYEITDRPPFWIGMPVKKALPGLFSYFDVKNYKDLKIKIDDDIWDIELPYDMKTGTQLYAALDFRKDKNRSDEARSLNASGFFEDSEDVEDIEKFDWPDPENIINKEACLAVFNNIPDDYPTMAVMWEANFQDACSAFGMEKALMNMIAEPELFEAVLSKITDFYLRSNEIYFDYVKDKLDIVMIGNDFGTQINTIASPELLRKLVFPYVNKITNQIKSYGYKVLYHSCGSVIELIPDMMEANVDIIHPLQAKAKDMDIQNIKNNYHGKVAFCGAVDAQELLVMGNPEDVYRQVMKIREIMPSGLIISPSHEAILPDIPPRNIEAMAKAVKEIV